MGCPIHCRGPSEQRRPEHGGEDSPEACWSPVWLYRVWGARGRVTQHLEASVSSSIKPGEGAALWNEHPPLSHSLISLSSLAAGGGHPGSSHLVISKEEDG